MQRASREQNAIIQAAYHGVSIKGKFYITAIAVCAKMIINAGIGEIIIKDGYPDKIAEDLLSEAGIKIRRAIQKKQ